MQREWIETEDIPKNWSVVLNYIRDDVRYIALGQDYMQVSISRMWYARSHRHTNATNHCYYYSIRTHFSGDLILCNEIRGRAHVQLPGLKQTMTLELLWESQPHRFVFWVRGQAATQKSSEPLGVAGCYNLGAWLRG